MTAAERAIADIIIGTRHRQDMGDLSALAASIRDVGLLHPVVIRPDGVLIAGERRIEACKRLGWTEIAVSVVDLASVAKGEFAENAWRSESTGPSLWRSSSRRMEAHHELARRL